MCAQSVCAGFSGDRCVPSLPVPGAGIEDLREKREEVNRSIAKDEEEKGVPRSRTLGCSYARACHAHWRTQRRYKTTCAFSPNDLHVSMTTWHERSHRGTSMTRPSRRPRPRTPRSWRARRRCCTCSSGVLLCCCAGRCLLAADACGVVGCRGAAAAAAA